MWPDFRHVLLFRTGFPNHHSLFCMKLPHRLRQAHDHLAAVLRQPRLWRRWLLAIAWRFALLAIVVVLLAVYLMPQVVDVLATWLSPPKPETRLFGLITEWRPNPLRPQTELVLWALFYARALYSAVSIVWRTRPTRADVEALTRSAMQTQVNLQAPKPPTATAPSMRPRDDRYRIENELGHGAMGIVYRAEDTRLKRTVALKVLAPHVAQDQSLRTRFLREAQAVARLNHPGIVQVYDLTDDQDGYRIAMEYVHGPSLAAVIGKRPQPIADVLRWGTEIADALATAHEQNVIHRDLKPANVLMAEKTQPKITDFGLARISDSVSHTATRSGTIMGSPAYMSPEQASGLNVDERSDIYAFGILLYELLTGRPPFTGDGAQVMAAQVTQPPDDIHTKRVDVPDALAKLVMELLSKAPAERPKSMRVVAERLHVMLHAGI